MSGKGFPLLSQAIESEALYWELAVFAVILKFIGCSIANSELSVKKNADKKIKEKNFDKRRIILYPIVTESRIYCNAHYSYYIIKMVEEDKLYLSIAYMHILRLLLILLFFAINISTAFADNLSDDITFTFQESETAVSTNTVSYAILEDDSKEFSKTRRFQTQVGICVNDSCYVFYSIVNKYGINAEDYFRIGQGLAYCDTAAGPYKKITVDGKYILWDDVTPAFGGAALENDGYIYIYGRGIIAPGKYGLALARVETEYIKQPNYYAYYNSEYAPDPWAGDASEASVIVYDVPEKYTVSYNYFLKKYLLIYYNLKTKTVEARVALQPWGIWSESISLYKCKNNDYCEAATELVTKSAHNGKKVFVDIVKKKAPYVYEVVFK